MELGIRLSEVAGMVTKGNCIADIGCDHGFVSIALVQNHIVERMIACDVNKGPLEHAKANVEACGLNDRIELRLGDGFHPVKEGECDGAIIAGMGGPLGLRILFEGREKIRSYSQIILQLQSKLGLVRFVLDGWGFRTEEETMVCEDGKFYPVIRVLPPKGKEFYEMNIPDFEAFLSRMEEELKKEPSDSLCNYTYGKQLLEAGSPALVIFLGKEEERLAGIAEKLEKNYEENADRLKEIIEEIDILMMAKWKLQGR